MISIPEILDPVKLAQANAIEPILDSLLDQLIEHDSVLATLQGKTLRVSVDGVLSDVRGPRMQPFFRIVLAGLGKRASDLSSQEFNPYQNESEFQWHNTRLFVAISNTLQKMELKSEKRTANQAFEAIGDPGSPQPQR